MCVCCFSRQSVRLRSLFSALFQWKAHFLLCCFFNGFSVSHLNTHIPLLEIITWNHHIINMQYLFAVPGHMAGWVAKLSLRHTRFRPPFHHPRLSARWHHTPCGRIMSRCLRHISTQKPSPLATWDGCENNAGILQWKYFTTIHFPFPKHPWIRKKVVP